MAATAGLSLPALLLALLASLAALSPPNTLFARASALTTTISAHERSCFYAWVDKEGEKVGFYFAVSRRELRAASPSAVGILNARLLGMQVQSGGSFDVDWVITDPNDTILLEGERDRQGDYIFTAQTVGEYSFCFSCAHLYPNARYLPDSHSSCQERHVFLFGKAR